MTGFKARDARRREREKIRKAHGEELIFYHARADGRPPLPCQVFAEMAVQLYARGGNVTRHLDSLYGRYRTSV